MLRNVFLFHGAILKDVKYDWINSFASMMLEISEHVIGEKIFNFPQGIEDIYTLRWIRYLI